MFEYGKATMWGPQPDKEPKKLKPGDRLSDGRVFMGDDPTAVLEAALERVNLALEPLLGQQRELLARLAEAAPERYGKAPREIGEIGEDSPAPRPVRVRKANKEGE